jgi:ATP-dependent DNA helicase UvrD/PcrA
VCARVRFTPGPLGHTTAELEAAAKRRVATSDRLVGSDAHARLIVAGPGTGKTYNFRRALRSAGEGGLALTFIRALADELAQDLADVAQVNTFHGFCKHLAYKLPLAGLGKGLDYYPPLFLLFAEDMRLLGDGQIGVRDLERALHTLDDEHGLISRIMELGSYYNAVSHADVVYRVLRHLEGNPDSVPEFPLVVVDEYQDFCRMETRLIAALKTASPVLAAGDDDQALYGFKDASPEFIRALARDDDFERFDLPYCSRCTEVVVDAVNNVVAEAQERGHLDDRIDRDYLCYLPEKLEDSETHPAIIHAECSVQTKKAPYMGMYVTEQIGRISDEDIAESHEGRYPTALVIGRRHFVEPVYEVIRESYPKAILRTSDRLEIDAVDGYRGSRAMPARGSAGGSSPTQHRRTTPTSRSQPHSRSRES